MTTQDALIHITAALLPYHVLTDNDGSDQVMLEELLDEAVGLLEAINAAAKRIEGAK